MTNPATMNGAPMERIDEKLDRIDQRLDDIEKKVDDNCRTVGTINKLFWVGLVAISGSIAAQLMI